jgi:hypothetical protein
VSCDLEKKLAVPALVKQHSFRRSLNRESAQDERPRGEAKTLVHVVPFQPHELNCFGLPKFLFRNQQLWMTAFKKVACSLESDNLN